MENNIEKDRYERAAKRVKRIRGFYIHALIYVAVNAMIIILNYQNLNADEALFKWQNFSTLIFWGIGLLSHAFSVFVPNLLMGKDWESRKIKELMERDKKYWE